MARTGFGRLLLAEWTKLRSVPRWVIAILAMIVLTVLMALFTASNSTFEVVGPPPVYGPDGKQVRDEFQFVHQPLSGDGGITARVLSLKTEGESTPGWAKAGIVIKASTKPGAPYAAMMLTPSHGVRMQANFTHDKGGGTGIRQPWLRLTRTGDSVTGYASANGTTWHKVGAVELKGFPKDAEAGLFVASPEAIVHERELGRSSVGGKSTASTATFGAVSLRGPWKAEPVSVEGGGTPAGGDEVAQADGVFTVSGTGDMVPNPPGDERIRSPLSIIIVGMLVAAALSVVFITSEYRRGMIQTTFVASPRRGRVLAAKAVVLAATTFAAGLVASFTAFLLSQPLLRAGGHRPPRQPDPSLTDPAVLRAIVGTAALVALVAVFSLAVGAAVRRSAVAITGVIALLLVPTLIVSALPVGAAAWLMRVTPTAGFSIQQTQARYDHMEMTCLPEDGCLFEQPFMGFGVTCAYAAVALAIALWLVRRRDV